MLNNIPKSQYVDIRGLRYHVLTWGDANAPAIFMLHGWMDVGASFQFLIQELQREWFVIAPDWRGYGRSEWNKDGYWFPDYIADLDTLLTLFSPDRPARLVGHSLGGNIVGIYAGLRPHRVIKVVSMEGFGLANEAPDRAPAKFIKWLDALEERPRFMPYASFAAIADRLQKSNPRLSRDKAEFLAPYVAKESPKGGAQLSSDPGHKLPFPTIYRMEEVLEIWRRATMPVLWIAADDNRVLQFLRLSPPKDVQLALMERMSVFSDIRLEGVSDSGHMMHHEQPRQVARLVEAFFVADV